MKKLLLLVAFLIAPSISLAASTLSPTTYSADSDVLSATMTSGYRSRAFEVASDGGKGSTILNFPSDTSITIRTTSGVNEGSFWDDVYNGGSYTIALPTHHDFHVLIFTGGEPLAGDDSGSCVDPSIDPAGFDWPGDWGAATQYDYCKTLAQHDYLVTYSAGGGGGGGGGPTLTGVAALIETASSTFSSDIGFNWVNVVNLMKSMMLLAMGTGLGVMKLMLPLVIALVTISAIVYFLYRAFRFFRN